MRTSILHASTVRTPLVVAALAAALSLAGCGGDGEDDTATDSAATEATAATTQAEDAGEATEAAGDGGGAAMDCDDTFQAWLVVNADYGYSVRRGTASEPADYTAMAADLEELAAQAPDDIADPVDTYVTQVVPYWTELGAIGFDPSDPSSVDADSFVAATELVDGNAVDAAFEEIRAFYSGPCEDG